MSSTIEDMKKSQAGYDQLENFSQKQKTTTFKYSENSPRLKKDESKISCSETLRMNTTKSAKA